MNANASEHLEETVKASVEVQATVIRGPESWQFFAFVFAATVALFFGLLDDLTTRLWWKMAVRVAIFLAVAYTILFNSKVRNWLVGRLLAFKTER